MKARMTTGWKICEQLLKKPRKWLNDWVKTVAAETYVTVAEQCHWHRGALI